MLAYGLFAAIGNALGGRLTDSLGVQRASVAIVAGHRRGVPGHVGGRAFASGDGRGGRCAGLVHLCGGARAAGRLMGIARLRAPQAQGVAAGLNIAGFNSGIALGAWAGGLTLGLSGWPESDWPAGCALLGLALLRQARTPVSVADECLNSNQDIKLCRSRAPAPPISSRFEREAFPT